VAQMAPKSAALVGVLDAVYHVSVSSRDSYERILPDLRVVQSRSATPATSVAQHCAWLNRPGAQYGDAALLTCESWLVGMASAEAAKRMTVVANFILGD